MRAIARGDADAFKALYRRHRDRVYGFALRMLGVEAVAEEVTHEAFLVLIEHPTRYDPERGSVLTFLCAVARNHVMRHFRRRGYSLEDDSEGGDSSEADAGAPDPLGELLKLELEAKVAAAVAALPALQREVILLREYHELSYAEMAEVTGVEVGVVKARLHRARQALARRLSPYVESERCYHYELP